MSKSTFNRDLLAFLDASPTPFHAVATMRERLLAAGFEALDEAEAWHLAPRGRYFVTRNESSLVAFRLGRRPLAEDGLRMVGAHTDSPCLKLKPNALIARHGYLQLGVEVYGGVLLNPWFDRDLSLAGRLTTCGRGGRLASRLVDFSRPIAVVPSLAIHLDREANSKRSVNKQTMLPPVLALGGKDSLELDALLRRALKESGAGGRGEQVLDFELFLYDTQRAALVGLEEEFIASARLDNLLSCHTGLAALIE
ncbi:MAG: M18 family aminopeptidase, partial [Gammaproteobacteria bacterium]